MKTTKILLFGLINYAVRFALGGFLIMGLQLNPVGFWFGFWMTLGALVIAFVLLKFVIKPETLKIALLVAMVWVGLALLLDIVTAVPIVHVTINYLLGELQTWTRLAVIILIAPFTVRK